MQRWHRSERLDIAVVMGGVSNERKISLQSGKAVAQALESRGHRVRAIDIRGRNIDAVKKAKPDLAFVALHGEFGEDGEIQTLLEEAGIPYTGSTPPASRTGMDKRASKRAYLRAAVPTPPYTVIHARMGAGEMQRQGKALGFPIVCKPPLGGSSLSVTIVRNENELQRALEAWKNSPAAGGWGRKRADFAPGAELILEKYIHGRELTVGILDGVPLPVVEIVSAGEFFDYRAKYEDENTIYNVPVSLIESVYRKVCDAAVGAYRATGCRHMARADIIYGYDGGVYVLELNTIPGLTSRSLLPMAARYSGLEFADLCERLCSLALGSQVRETVGILSEIRKKSA